MDRDGSENGRMKCERIFKACGQRTKKAGHCQPQQYAPWLARDTPIKSELERWNARVLHPTVSATSKSRKSTCRSPLGILAIWRTCPKLCHLGAIRYLFKNILQLKIYLAPTFDTLELLSITSTYSTNN